MRQMLRLLLAFFVVGPVLAEGRGPAVRDYPAVKVADGAYVIHGPLGHPSVENQGFMNNPGFIVGKDGVVVIDPGSSVQSGEMVMRQIRKVTDLPVVALIDTHVHGDHWLANHAFHQINPKIPTYGHPKMIEKVEQGEGDSWIALLKRLTEGATDGTGIYAPNLAVRHGDEVELAGIKFQFLYGEKAHSDTDLMVFIPEKSLMFLGDNVMNNRFGRMDNGTFKGNIAAIEMAMASGATVFVPGHGPTGNIAVPQAFQRYLSILREEVAKYLDEGLSDFEMKPKVVEALAEFKDWVDFNAEVGRHISVAYLEVEAEMF